MCRLAHRSSRSELEEAIRFAGRNRYPEGRQVISAFSVIRRTRNRHAIATSLDFTLKPLFRCLQPATV